MTTRFDLHAAEKLISEMDMCCTNIQNEARNLLMMVDEPSDWNDPQFFAFQSNINEIAKDMNTALKLEGDYMKTFYKRITELRG